MKKYLLIAFVLLTSMYIKAQSSEFQAKALFIYNFTRLVEWPAGHSGEFVIGVIGKSLVFEELQKTTAGRKVGNQTIVVKQFNSPNEIVNCSILYVASGASSKLPEIQNIVQSQNTLIVGEKTNLVNQGAAISFIINESKIAFHLNVDNAQKYGLKVSKSLLELSARS